MKTFLFSFLISALPVAAQDFGDDNPSGDWLPIPDGYVWPKAVDPPPKFESEVKKYKELDEAEKKGVRKHWPDDELPEEVDVAEVDLNGDDKPELFLAIPELGGSGGPFFEILTLKGDQYQSVGAIQGWGFQFLTMKNGWLQIEAMSRGGGGYYTRYLMTYGKKRYITTRNEGHDYHEQKVTIREPELEGDVPE